MIAKLAYCGSLLIAACCVAGCALTATITTLKPAAADVSHVRRLAVLYCAGPKDSGQIAHSTIVSKLMENGFYSLANPAELARFARGPLYNETGLVNMQVAVEAARNMRLDAILAARVRYRRDSDNAPIQIGDPTTTAGVDFELVDVRTGRILCKDRTTASYKGELTDDRTGPTSEQKVLAKLAREAAGKVADRIAPHHTSLDVQLAASTIGQGARKVRDGNKLAGNDNWAGAIECWQRALDEDPENHAAMYNLGLAYEAVGSFGRAREMYSAAINQEDQGLYHEALNRVERSAREQQLALAQVHRVGARPASPHPGYVHRIPLARSRNPNIDIRNASVPSGSSQVWR